MEKTHAYVNHWSQAFKRNIGLLLFGDVGTGKSFLAGCIANALLDQDIPVLMANFPTILARLCGTFGEDRTAFLDSLGDYDLLIIDDLGVERNTKYALEQMFSIIDGRYRCNKPLIVTTNLKLDELKHPPDLAHARIYNRILECYAPILFAGKNFREDNAASTKAAARHIITKSRALTATGKRPFSRSKTCHLRTFPHRARFSAMMQVHQRSAASRRKLLCVMFIFVVSWL